MEESSERRCGGKKPKLIGTFCILHSSCYELSGGTWKHWLSNLSTTPGTSTHLAPGERQAAKLWADTDKTVLLWSGFFFFSPSTSFIIFDGKGTVVSCVTLRDVFPETESGCSSHPCYLTAGFGVCLSQAQRLTDKGVGNSRCCPLAYCHPAGFQLPPSLFLEKPEPYPTESTLSRTVSRSCSSYQHGFRTTEDKQTADVQQHGNGTLLHQKRGVHKGGGRKHVKWHWT